MEFDETYKVYVRVDEAGTVTAINSSAFISDFSDWLEVDEGNGDRYHHAQNNYLEKGLATKEGVYLYKLVDGTLAERNEAEISSDVEKWEANRPLTLEELNAVIGALLKGVER